MHWVVHNRFQYTHLMEQYSAIKKLTTDTCNNTGQSQTLFYVKEFRYKILYSQRFPLYKVQGYEKLMVVVIRTVVAYGLWELTESDKRI